VPLSWDEHSRCRIRPHRIYDEERAELADETREISDGTQPPDRRCIYC
jgi:hypothetical protein